MCVHKSIHNVWSTLVGGAKRQVDLIEDMLNTVCKVGIKIA